MFLKGNDYVTENYLFFCRYPYTEAMVTEFVYRPLHRRGGCSKHAGQLRSQRPLLTLLYPGGTELAQGLEVILIPAQGGNISNTFSSGKMEKTILNTVR